MTKKQYTDGTGSRREFVKQMALFGLAAQLPLSFWACSPEKNNMAGSGKVPYKIWEEMLLVLQTCPDYLEARMKNLVASKDAEAMFNFVRDEIYLMPTNNKAFGYVGTQLKWGIKGALRYGMATPREKAELLTQMFSNAGIPSKVVFEQTNISPDEAMLFFLRPIQRRFNLEISNKQWKQWETELQTDKASGYKIPEFDADLTKTNTLAEQLWDLIPDKDKVSKPDFDFRWDNYRTPTVEFQIDGVIKYAHLFDPDVPFGALKNEGRVSAADPVRLNEDTVEMRLTYREAIHPDKETELISGTWKARDLISRRIQFSCLNGVDMEQSTVTPVGNLRVFTPVLAFQDFDATLETMEKHSVIANPFTLEGKKIELQEDVNKNAPVVVSPSNTELVKTVNKVEVKAIPVYKSLVKIHVTPVDSEGNIVEGLPASNFNFTDNGQAAQALMESNRISPKILLLYDTSLSMPKEYYGENMDAFIASLHEKILVNFSSAIIDKWETPSELFTWLLKASKTDYDLIVYATDGDNDDVFNEYDLAIYRNGPLALILNVYNSDTVHTKKTFDKMAEITNGSVFHARNQSATVEKIVSVIKGLSLAPYTFSFYANKGTEHEVVLEMDNKRLRSADNFTLPEHSENIEINQGIIGIYLDLKVNNTHFKRVLAGWDPVTQRNQKPDNAHFSDVKSLILGGAMFYFEGEGPTLATSVADLLKYRLSTRAWGEALLDNDFATAKNEFGKGGFQYHPDILSLMAPIEDGVTSSTYTFASGIRIGICKQQLHLEANAITESFDFLPTSDYTSFSSGNENAFKINLQKTAQLSIREASAFSNSTYNELNNNVTLVERTNAINNQWFTGIPRDDLHYNYWYERIYRGDGNYKIFDVTRAGKAFWQINSQGELYGILKDGTGGGSKSIEQQLKELNRLIDLYMAIFSAMGVANMPLSVVATYGKTLVKLYAIVTEVLIVMDSTGMEDKVAEALKELACNVNKEIMFFALGRVGEVMGSLDLMISLMGGDGLPGLGCG
ncbi:MAG: hypothetical protein R2821_12650 [Flavobacteriaceae bacterium]